MVIKMFALLFVSGLIFSNEILVKKGITLSDYDNDSVKQAVLVADDVLKFKYHIKVLHPRILSPSDNKKYILRGSNNQIESFNFLCNAISNGTYKLAVEYSTYSYLGWFVRGAITNNETLVGSVSDNGLNYYALETSWTNYTKSFTCGNKQRKRYF